jgi:rubredoxin
MKADHVVMRTDTHQFECRHCGATYQPALPAPISMFIAMTKEFTKVHRFCKPMEKK